MVLLHKLLIEKCLKITAEAVVAEQHITYQRDTNDAIAAVDRGEAQLACLLNAVYVQEEVPDCVGRRCDAAEINKFLSKAVEWIGDF